MFILTNIWVRCFACGFYTLQRSHKAIVLVKIKQHNAIVLVKIKDINITRIADTFARLTITVGVTIEKYRSRIGSYNNFLPANVSKVSLESQFWKSKKVSI